MNVQSPDCWQGQPLPAIAGGGGYTIVEMVVTIFIVTALAVTLGTFFVKLLTLREREREEAYVREKLSDVCGAYADAMSVGSAIVTTSTNATIVKYRQETGGVSLETGLVSRVVYIASTMNATNSTMDLDIYSFNPKELDIDRRITRKVRRSASGDAALLPLTGDMVSCTLTPLRGNGLAIGVKGMSVEESRLCEKMVPSATYQVAETALGYLEVKARYWIEEDDGGLVAKTVTVGRVVRLWNRE